MEHLSRFITNNFVDDRDTTVDNSTNQQVNTHGGDFDQDIDVHSTVASGDGAVAAGDDIRDSTITTGDNNQVGDDNIKGNNNVQGDDNQVVHGDGNTTAFGAGDATSANLHNVDVSGGGALSVGGNATGNQHNTGLARHDDDHHDQRDAHRGLGQLPPGRHRELPQRHEQREPHRLARRDPHGRREPQRPRPRRRAHLIV